MDRRGIRPCPQRVVIGRTGQVLDRDQHVALGIAAGRGAAIQPDRDRRRGRGVGYRIDPRAAVDRIGPGAAVDGVVAVAAFQQIVAGAAHQHVIARAADQHVIGGRAGQCVVAGRTDHLFDADQHIAFGIAAVRGARGQIDVHRRRRGRIVDRVEPGPAIQRVRPGAADQRVVAATAFQPLVRAGPGQAVVIAAADDVFDIGQDIAGGIAAQPDPAIQEHRDSARRGRIVDRVEPGAAIQRIRPGAADQRVVARAAFQHVVAAAAGQAVVKGRSDQVLDVDQHIALGIAAMADRAIQPHRHCRRRAAVIDRVEARSAIQRVGPRAADQHVIAFAADQAVVAGAAIQRVVARAAQQRVIAAIAHDMVIAGPAIEQFGIVHAADRVVVGRSDDMFDVGYPVTLGIAAVARAAIQRDLDPVARCRIADRVEPGAAIQRVRARAADQRVVAVAAHQHIVAAAAGQAVIIGRSDHALDPDQRVAIGIAALAGAGLQVDIDRRVRLRIVGSVDACAAVQRVRPERTHQRVIAGPARQQVGIGRTVKLVGEVRPGDPLDVDVGIALGIAAVVGAAIQPCHDACVRCRIVGNVEPGAAVQHIGARATGQRVVACPAQQRVVAGRAAQLVIVIRSDQHLDRHQGIALRIAADADAAIQRDMDCRSRSRIVGRIDAIAAIEQIRARAADQRVVARPAVQLVVARIAGQRVIARRPDQVLDADQHVALGIAAMRDAGAQIHRNRRGRRRIVRGIAAIAAIERVRTRAADQRVVAKPARQHVGPGITGQRVVVVRPDDVFDGDIGIALGGAAMADAGGQIDIDPGVRIGIVRAVVAIAAVQRVGPLAAHQRVVAPAALQQVGRRIADQRVGIGPADHVLDAHQHVALGHVARRGRAVQMHRHRALRIGIVGGVEPAAADQRVGAIAADQRVIASAAIDHVRARIAGQRVVERRSGQVLDPDQHVALGIAAMAGRAIERDIHRRGRGVVIGRVDPVSADQRIRARAADQNIVARPAFQAVVAGRTVDRIVKRRSDRVFDIGDHIAFGIAPARDGAIKMQLDRSGRGGIIDRVEPVATIDRVGARAADQRVIARPALQQVVAGAAIERVVERRSLEALDADIGIAQRIAALVRAVERGHDPGGGACVRRDVEPVPAVEHIGAGPAFKRVVARAAVQGFVARRPDQMVIERRSGQDLDIGISIALGIAAVADLAVEIDLDPHRRIGKVDGIGPPAAIDVVRTRAALDRVVLGPADQRVVIGRSDQHLDARKHVAFGIAAMAGGAVKVHLDRGGRSRIVGGIDPVTAVQRVGPGAADQHVVARAPVQLFVACRTDQRVGTIGADDMLDVDQGVALGGAAMRRRAVKVDLHPGQRARIDAGRHRLAGKGPGIIDRVEPATAIDVVRARAAIKRVVVRIADQRVVVGRSDDILDVGVGIALGIASAALAGGQIDGDPGRRLIVDHGVDTGAAIDLVGAGAGMDRVVAIARIDDVARRVGKQHFDRIARNRVGHGHVGGAVDHLDPELGCHFRSERRVLAGVVHAQLHRQVEFVLESRGIDRRAHRGQRVDQVKLEMEHRFAARHRDGLAVGIGGGGQRGDVGLIGIKQPALVGQRGIGDAVSGGQRGDQHLAEIKVLGRNHRHDIKHAQSRPGRGVLRIVGPDHVIAAGPGDGFLGALRGIACVRRRIGAAGIAKDGGVAILGGGFGAFGIVQRISQRRHQLAKAGRAQDILIGGHHGTRRDHPRRRAGRTHRVADLFGQRLAFGVELVLFLLFGGLLRLGRGGIGGLHPAVAVRALAALVVGFGLGVGRAQLQRLGAVLLVDFSHHRHHVVGCDIAVGKMDDRLLARKLRHRHARQDDPAAVGKDQHHVDIDDFGLERCKRAIDVDIARGIQRRDPRIGIAGAGIRRGRRGGFMRMAGQIGMSRAAPAPCTSAAACRLADLS